MLSLVSKSLDIVQGLLSVGFEYHFNWKYLNLLLSFTIVL